MELTDRSSRHSRTKHGYIEICLHGARQSVRPVEHTENVSVCRVRSPVISSGVTMAVKPQARLESEAN